jgi:hypothetical protein
VDGHQDTPGHGLPPYPGSHPSYPPPRQYREARPLRMRAAMAGFTAGLVWFLLLAAVSWSVWSYFWFTLAGIFGVVAAVGVLAWRGDRGAAAGLAVVTAGVAAVFVLLTWFQLG